MIDKFVDKIHVKSIIYIVYAVQNPLNKNKCNVCGTPKGSNQVKMCEFKDKCYSPHCGLRHPSGNLRIGLRKAGKGFVSQP